MITDNWLAFGVAILHPNLISPERSFDLLLTRQGKRDRSITEEDVREMIKLKKTMTYEEIGNLYGLSKYAVYSRIRYQKKGVKVNV